MISTVSNLFTPEDLPKVGERVAYVSGGGTKFVGHGIVLGLDKTMRGTWWAIIHLDDTPLLSEKRVKLSSLRKVTR